MRGKPMNTWPSRFSDVAAELAGGGGAGGGGGGGGGRVLAAAATAASLSSEMVCLCGEPIAAGCGVVFKMHDAISRVDSSQRPG